VRKLPIMRTVADLQEAFKALEATIEENAQLREILDSVRLAPCPRAVVVTEGLTSFRRACPDFMPRAGWCGACIAHDEMVTM
jgi:hypothetical protein